MIVQFNQNPQNPIKILDTGGRTGIVYLQVLDASTLFIGTNRDQMAQTTGAAGQQQGLQIIQTDRIKAFWWKGEIWAVNTTPGAIVDLEFLPIDIERGAGRPIYPPELAEEGVCMSCGR